MTATLSTSAAPSPAERHAAALTRRSDRAARDHARGAAPDVLAGHKTAIDRLALIKAKAEERAAAKAERAHMDAHFAAKDAAEDAVAMENCRKLVERIGARAQAEAAAEAARREAETPQERHAASLRRKSPHTERDEAIQEAGDFAACPIRANDVIAVRVNRAVDILARELAAGNITPAEHFMGRLCQQVWERGEGARSGSAGWNGAGTRDQVEAHDRRIRITLEDARKVQEFNAQAGAAVGWTGIATLKRYLVGGQTFKSHLGPCASTWQVAKEADHFRRILGNLTEAMHPSMTGKPPRIRGECLAPQADDPETDAKGRAVPAGRGQYWGAEEARYAPHMNTSARALAGRTARVRDIVNARHRVTAGEP